MVDHGLNGDGLGSFLCIRVGLKINEPLKRCVTLRLSADEPAKQYEIEYERLPYFCLYCGQPDHVGAACNAFDGQGMMEMDSGMDCPLVQVFKRRRVHLNQGVSEAALSDMGHLRPDGDISQILPTAPRLSDKGKTVLGEDITAASAILGPPSSFYKGSIQRGFQLGRAKPWGSPVMTDNTSGAKRTPVMVLDEKEGRGGLALLWQHGVEVSILSSSPGHIDSILKGVDMETFCFTRFYGNPEMRLRWHSWDLLRRIAGTVQGSWLGYKFTWSNRWQGDGNVKLRMDRMVANGDFVRTFPEVITHHLNSMVSNHLPLLSYLRPSTWARKHKRFLFEEMWTTVEGCQDVITHA
ncbi:unnamed protein product [Prunus brigantina]